MELIKPGPTDKAMTAGFKAKGIKMARPIDVSKRIVHVFNEVVEKFKVNF